MSIKMPLKFLGSYKVVMRRGETEKQEICQKLTMTPIGERGNSTAGGDDSPTYIITYFCFGCRRVLEGRLKVNQEDGAVFQVDEREYEFRPSDRMC